MVITSINYSVEQYIIVIYLSFIEPGELCSIHTFSTSPPGDVIIDLFIKGQRMYRLTGDENLDRL